MQIIEAVPNISEGKNTTLLRTLENLLCTAPGIRFLGSDANPSANRTVFTLAGPPKEVCTMLFRFISLATQLIDMRNQRGAHPRLGAVDVCPLIPLQNIPLGETARLAQALGKQVGEELQIPVYLYEAAAFAPERQNLTFIRQGEYESLPDKLHILPPDFGPRIWTAHTAQTGACVIGARNILIAFNINLNTSDPAAARQIAAKIREKNKGIKGLKAIGWYMENFNRAQVSCNITDYRTASLHLVYETCQKEAATLGLEATGCELVGLTPLEALLETGKYYAPLETNREALISAAANGLNLSDVKPFHPQEQILEYKACLIR